MQCNDIQEMLSAYIDGVLDENEVSAVEEHIRICSFCSQELTALRETVKLLNSLGEVSPLGEFRSQLMQRLEALPTESDPETGRVGGPNSARRRQWFRGINKYLVAAVLMIGLGIGTGLYKLGIPTGYQTFDLALNAKALNTAPNVPLAKDSANTEQREIALAKPKTQETAQESSQSITQTPAQVQITMADSSAPADNSVNNPADGQTAATSESTAEKPAMLAQGPVAEKKVAAVKPEVIQNASLVIEVGNFQIAAAKIPEMIWRASGFISKSTENLVRPATGYFTLKVPAQNLQGFLLELEHLGKVTQIQTQGNVVANDLKNVDESAAYSTVELEIKAESKPAKVSSTMAGWILPGALLAVGIGCAAYYFCLRWRKN